jgi:hypothetical protein
MTNLCAHLLQQPAHVTACPYENMKCLLSLWLHSSTYSVQANLHQLFSAPYPERSQRMSAAEHSTGSVVTCLGCEADGLEELG